MGKIKQPFESRLNHIDDVMQLQTLHGSIQTFYDSILILFRNFSELMQEIRDLAKNRDISQSLSSNISNLY